MGPAIFFTAWFVMAAIAAMIGQYKGRPALGAWLGVLFGLFGILIITCWAPSPTKEAERAERARRAQQLNDYLRALDHQP